jgi:hypothetical protein
MDMFWRLRIGILSVFGVYGRWLTLCVMGKRVQQRRWRVDNGSVQASSWLREA